MDELFRIVGNDRKSTTYRQLTQADVERYKAHLQGGEPYRVEHDGYLTTIREYAPQVAADAEVKGFPASWLDAPCVAHVIGTNEGSVICSGRAIVGFYEHSRMPVRRPAYIVVNTHEHYGPIGMMLVQSA